MLAATAVALFGLPLILPGLAVADLVRAKRKLPSVRTYLFVLQYLVNDSVEIVLAPLLWARAGFGRRLHTAASIERHRQVQRWSAELLEKRGEQLLGLTVELDAVAVEAARPGPVVAISRHVSIFDSTLPASLLDRAGLDARGVLMGELLADPGFDLIYTRTGNVFIPRDDGPAAVAAIREMTADANEGSAFLIYPEGRLFGPTRLTRAMERLLEHDPERAARLDDLSRLLPPRSGGLFALLDALPAADLLVVDHRGLDRFPRLKYLTASVPVNDSITVTAHRIQRAEIPNDLEARQKWLDELWLDWDGQIAAAERV